MRLGERRREEQGRTFKAGLGGQVERRVLPGDGVLGVAPVGRPHLVECGDAVARLELKHVGADLLDDAGYVVALVGRLVGPYLGDLPVLGVGTADDDFDEQLVGVRLGDRGVDDLDLRSWGGGEGVRWVSGGRQVGVGWREKRGTGNRLFYLDRRELPSFCPNWR